MFSRACEYGLRAVIFIAHQTDQNRRVGVEEIAAAVDSPVPFTAKILQRLSRGEFIKSVKGPNGGFTIRADKIQELKLSDIVNALDGTELYTKCGLGLKTCNATKPCPLHKEFAVIRNRLRLLLESTTLKSLIEDLDKQATFLKRS